MSILETLYQESILEHSRRPKNFGRLKNPTETRASINPFCGDKYIIDIHLKNQTIKDIAFFGEGCAISKAAASVMTELVKNKTAPEALKLIEHIKNIFSNKITPQKELMMFDGVKQHPGRIKCATLAWETLNNIIQNDPK